tara:strand:- start:65 stop:1129 length:1065 start_codon:yes stop_codon:yes gene_type:complete
MARRFSLSALRTFITRGDRAFVAFGALYLRSTSATGTIREQLNSGLPEAPSGTAFVRWGRAPKAGRDKAPSLAVLISGFGRFGNSILQVLNSYQIARSLSAQEVFYFRYDILQNLNIALAGNVDLIRVTLLEKINQRTPGLIWKTDAMIGQQVLIQPCSPLAKGIAQNLAAAINSGSGSRPTMGGVLTIHLRSGDIFWSNPHRSYGQPPFSYYLRILESKPWEHVILVAEDDQNPCYEMISDWCEKHQKNLEVTGLEFQDTLSAIAGARNLVTGGGTFVPAITYLFPLERTIYTFEHTGEALMCGEEISILNVRDQLGDYARQVLSKNWTNSGIQRELMVSYPPSGLSGIEQVN